MKIRMIMLFTLAALAYSVTLNAQTSDVEIVAVEDVQWGYLNPLRGDKSPGAAELWGDRSKDAATGMLVRFKPGFASPPHIHNITYRGVVIEGLLHNDDPEAAKLWMPTGSFWTQPAGDNHITAANGDTNLIFLEIESGPYLVKPSKEAFDNGERAVNLHASNLVWLGADALTAVNASGVEVASLWGQSGSGEPCGALVRLPAGFSGSIAADAGEFRLVVIDGQLLFNPVDKQEQRSLLPGSYVGFAESAGAVTHTLSIAADEETLVYIRTEGRYTIQGL